MSLQLRHSGVSISPVSRLRHSPAPNDLHPGRLTYHLSWLSVLTPNYHVSSRPNQPSSRTHGQLKLRQLCDYDGTRPSVTIPPVVGNVQVIEGDRGYLIG